MTGKIPAFRKSPAPGTGTGTADAGALDAFLDGSPLVGRSTTPAEEPPVRQWSKKMTGEPDVNEAAIYRTVNVKLNKRRYTQLKLLSTLSDKYMQTYLEELVDELLERNKDLIPNYQPKP